MKQQWKKMLSIALAFFMVFALVVPQLIVAEDDKEAEEAEEVEEVVDEEEGEDKEEDKNLEVVGPQTDNEYHIDVILKTTASEYWGYVEAGALAYMEKYPNVKVTVKGAPSETHYDEQMNIIETDLSSDEYNAYVIAPLQADMVTNLLKDTEKPIVAVDTKIEAPEVLSFVGTGNLAAAKLGGEEAVKLAKERGWEKIEAIAISGVQGDSTAEDRLKGYQEGIEAEGGTFLEDEVQYADAVADKAVTAMEAIIQKYPEGIAIVVCNNDDMAMGAARAAKGHEAFKDTIFVGFDGNMSACDAIIDGEETLSVAQDAYGMGFLSVDIAVRALDNTEVEEFYDSGASIVNPENAEERKAQLEEYLGK